jgi:hypothetical protein
MRFLLDLTSRRTTRLLAASALLIGVGGATMAASSASAAACGPTTFTTTNCTMTGTATIGGGSLGLAAPATQAWPVTLNGLDQQVVSTGAASFTVQDVTGSGDGWTVTAAATQFTGALGTPVNTLGTTGTLVYNGSTTDETTGATPDNTCAPNTTCTPATTTGLTMPVLFTTDGTVANIYDADTGTGMGNIVIGALAGGAPAAWWLNVPASAVADTYISTITLAINSGPVVGT